MSAALAQAGSHHNALPPARLLAAMVPVFDLAPHREHARQHRRRVLRNAAAAGIGLGLVAGALLQFVAMDRSRLASSLSTSPETIALHTQSGRRTDANPIEEVARLQARLDALDQRRRQEAARTAWMKRLPATLDALAAIPPSAAGRTGCPAAGQRQTSADARRTRLLADDAALPRIAVRSLRWLGDSVQLDCTAVSDAGAVDASVAAVDPPPAIGRQPSRIDPGRPRSARTRKATGRGHASLVATVDDWLALLRAALPESLVTASSIRLDRRQSVYAVDFTVQIGDQATKRGRDD